MVNMITLIHHPDDPKRMGDLLVENLHDAKWTLFRAAVAFVKNSGVKHIKVALQKFLIQGDAEISAGIDHAGTSKEGLSELLESLGTKGEGWVFHNNEGRYTFHPKVYLFENETSAECFIGSGNLTEGGLYTNYEAFVQMKLSKGTTDDKRILSQLNKILDTWTDSSHGMALRLTPALIQELVDKGLGPDRSPDCSSDRRSAKLESSRRWEGSAREKSVWIVKRVQAAPKAVAQSKHKEEQKKNSTGSKAGNGAVQTDGLAGFFITLQQTDRWEGNSKPLLEPQNVPQ